MKSLTKRDSSKKPAVTLRESLFIKTLTSNLQQPLNQLIQFSHIALQRIQGKQTQLAGDYLVEIKWISEELLITITDLLELSQLKSGEKEFEIEEIDTITFFDSIRRQFQPIADNRICLFSVKSDLEHGCIFGDYAKLVKVFNILLRSAFRHIKEKGLVEIYAWQEEKTAYISIYDDASAPAVKKMQEVFTICEDEWEGTTSSLNGSMDFSLSICKELMLGQGGDIFMDECHDGKSTRFILSLPIAQSLLD